MPYELCHHFKADGKPCQSPALTGEKWCYFHIRLHVRHPLVPSTPPAQLVLPAITDHTSILAAASVILQALAAGQLNDKRAKALIRTLEIATRGLTAPTASSREHPRCINPDTSKLGRLKTPPSQPK